MRGTHDRPSDAPGCPQVCAMAGWRLPLGTSENTGVKRMYGRWVGEIGQPARQDSVTLICVAGIDACLLSPFVRDGNR
jgi:hypothetical protein